MSVNLVLLLVSFKFLLVYAYVDIVTNTASCANDSQALCTTLPQCLSSISECITADSMLSFEAGVHRTIGLSGMLIFQDISNVTFLGSNSSIQCEFGVGFLFNIMDNFTIRGLEFVDCGAVLTRRVVSVLFPSQDPQTFLGTKSALIITNSLNVNINLVSISNSYGFGLFAVNWVGHSGMNHIVVSHSNSRAIRHYQGNFQECENPDHQDCSGGGIVVVYDTCGICFPGVHELELSGVVVEYGVNLQNWDVFMYTEPAGGLTISLWQERAYVVEITVKDSIFRSNTGKYAGNAAMNFQYGANFVVKFVNTSFLHGNSEVGYYRDMSKSGGMYCNWQQGLDQSQYSKVLILDNCTFENNSALQGGALYISSVIDDDVLASTVLEMHINNTDIRQNKGHAGIVNVQEDNTGESDVPTNSLSLLLNNTRIYKNAPLNSISETVFYITASNSTLFVKQLNRLVLANLLIAGNQMRGLHAIGIEQFSFIGTNFITGNVADNGGGMKLRRSRFLLQPNAYLYISNNRASMHGGGIFIEEDSISTSNACFFSVTDVTNISEPQIIVSNNYANLSGHSIFGGRIDRCQYDNTLSITGHDAFNRSFEIPYNRSLTEISSNIHQLCFCVNARPQCSIKSQKVSVFPGQSFSLPAVAVGQLDGTTIDTAISFLINTTSQGYITLGSQQSAQPLHTACTHLNYSLNSGENEVSFIAVQTNYGRTRLPNSILLLIEVHTKECPIGFHLKQVSMRCDCNHFLEEYSVACFIDEDINNIERTSPVWIGYDKIRGRILAHDSCPFGYCTLDSVNLSLLHGTDLQCQLGHSGILCGGCKENLSAVFGNQACRVCSNKYLSLLLVFFLAGLVLVAVMIYGNLTISQGKFNGLILYANIVRVHHSVFFPPQHVNVITVFIAWLNLDLGIETCFYNKMDAYTRVWLQYAFPAYIWLLVLSIIILGHYFKFAAKLFGSNAIQVLATLLLLSYTKIQRIVLESWSSTLVRHENGSMYVWLIDGNVQFLKGKHIFLALMSLVALVFFLIPFTLIILCEYPLQSKCGTYMLRYKLTPLIDAYQGPYKTKFRWWTGAMLLLRSSLLLASGINIFGDPSLNLELILSLCVVMLGIMWNAGTIYKDRNINMLESFFIVNLGLLSGWTVYNRFALPKHLLYQMVISYFLVGTCFALFLAIIVSQVYLCIKNKVIAKFKQHNRCEPQKEHQSEELVVQVKENGAAFRESLIEDSEN